MIRRVAMLILLLLPFSVVASEGAPPAPDPAQPLVGRWREIGYREIVIDFRIDGSGLTYFPAEAPEGGDGSTHEFRWSLSDDGMLGLMIGWPEETPRSAAVRVTFLDGDRIRLQEPGQADDASGSSIMHRFQAPLPANYGEVPGRE